MFGLTNRGGRVLTLLPIFFILLMAGASALNATDVNAYTTPADGVKLPLFLLMLGLAFAFIFLGAFSNSPLLATAGLVALLFASFIVLEGLVMVPSGQVNYSYDNYTLPDGNETSFISGEEKVYDLWDDGNNAFIGWVMVIVTIILMFSLVAGLQDD